MMSYAKTKKQRKSKRQFPEMEGASGKRSQLGMALWQKALQQAGARSQIEQQWLAWQKLYAGYESLEPRGQGGLSLAQNKGSDVSVNVVRTKTDTMVAWILNLLFQSGEKPWMIKATPVPETAFMAKHASRGLVSPQVRVPSVPTGVSDEMIQKGEQAKQEIELARRSAELMERIIHDRLVQCDYQRQIMSMMEQAGRLGTGVVKAPIRRTSDYRRAIEPRWFMDPDTGQPYESISGGGDDDDVPSAIWVDLWNVYPDMRARDFKDCEFVFEKHVLTRNQLLKLAQIPGYDKDGIVRAVRRYGSTKEHESQRDGDMDHVDKGRRDDDHYVMWEYHGPILFDDYATISKHLVDRMDDDEEEMRDGIEADRQVQREMGMVNTNVIIRVVDGQIISIARSDFAANQIYHAYTPIPTTTLFGNSMPGVLAKLQKMLNSLFRDAMSSCRTSNTGHLAVRDGVKRARGSNDWDHMQVWHVPNSVEANSTTPPLQIISMQGQTKEVLEALHLTRQLIDDISGIPLISQGDQASHITKTASGMGLLHDNAQTSARRMVRLMDDQVIKPLIRSFYKWQMLYGQNVEAKGDYAVQAIGSSVHYGRQQRGEMLPVFWGAFSQDADARAVLKIREIVKQYAASMNIPADLIIKSDEELTRDAKAMEQQVDPEMEAQAQEIAIKKQKVQTDYEAKMHKIMTDKQVAMAQLELEAKKLRSQERRDAAQIGREQRAAKREAQALGAGGTS